jgi:hypothetical protein
VSILSEHDRVKLLVQLTCGLLSTGKYTTEPLEDWNETLKTYEVDWEDWEKAGYPRKHPFEVLDDAERLLKDIQFIAQEGAQ